MSARAADSIAAIATAPGRGAIGIVRISGHASKIVAQALANPGASGWFEPRKAHYRRLRAADGSVIDDGLVLLFEAPASYTGEDLLELHAHGGRFVLQRLLDACFDAARAAGVPLRLARPGEFTERAFLNDKLDLAQAEAVADLIDAASVEAARGAAASLSGAFSQQVDALAARLVELRALVEATLDFPEEEVEFLTAARALQRLGELRAALSALRAQARQGAVLRDGMAVVLAGRPNVGKSALLNALAGQEVALVTPIAGTTRDRLRERILLPGGVPLDLIDTAGLRDDSVDLVERLGIERTRAELARADAIVQVLDAAQGETAEDRAVAAELDTLAQPGVARLRVWNKLDLLPHDDAARARADAPAASGAPTHGELAAGPSPAAEGADAAAAAPAPNRDIWLSAKTGAGLERLQTALLDAAGWRADAETPFLARKRHLLALDDAAREIDAALQQGALELQAEHLRLAHRALQTITGAYHADDLLGEIFGRFCIGK
jgi:tRNA modification GTPase